MKGSKWPLFYLAKVPVFCKRADTVEEVDFPFLLPHEAIAAMNDTLDMKLYFGSSTSSPLHWAQMTAAAQLLDCTPEAVLPMGLHGDGVPFNVGDSLEQFSFNCPCWSGEGLSPRLLFTAVPKQFVGKRQTIACLLNIAAWSFKMMAMGTFPVARHDGTPWLSTDHQRAKQAGNPMHIQGFLIEARGEWAFYRHL